MKGKASPTRLPSITPHAWDSLLASTRLSDCTLVMPSRSKASGVAHRSRGSIRIPCNKYLRVPGSGGQCGGAGGWRRWEGCVDACEGQRYSRASESSASDHREAREERAERLHQPW
eukprot:scaffold31563_cov27-Tisochrysis_lutea.AAC.4